MDSTRAAEVEALFDESPPRDGSSPSRKRPAAVAFEGESAEEMEDFLYYQFFNVEEDDREKASNGWQVASGTHTEHGRTARRADDQSTVTITGRVPLDNAAKIANLGCKAQNAFVLVDSVYRDAVFYGMKEALMPYFVYTFQASKGDRPGAGGRTVFFVRPHTLTWHAMPVTPPIARHVFENNLPGTKNAALRTLAVTKLAAAPQEVVLDLPKLENMLCGSPTEVVRMREMGIVKRIFLHERLKPLYTYYHVQDAEHLDVQAIDTLCRLVTRPSAETNPVALCFVTAMRNLGIRCRDFDRVWYLPELTYAQYARICDVGKFVPPRLEALAVKLYDHLRTLIKRYGHKFIDDDSLRLGASADEQPFFGDALELLRTTYRAIEMEPLGNGATAVYMHRTHMCERIILDGLKVVMSRFADEPPMRATPQEVEAYPLRPDHALCSEQLLAVMQILERPISVVSGPAGAGKSASLSELLAHLGAIVRPAQVTFAAYQGNNAATAAVTNTPFAATAHHILAKHANKCRRSPCFGRTNKRAKQDAARGSGAPRGRGRGGRGGRGGQTSLAQFVDVLERQASPDEDGEYVDCPLENVRVLVIDEIGLFYEDLFAPLLHVLTTCGKLRMIVVCGDHRQMVQIQPGQLQQDLLEGFAPWTIKYEHQHRFSDENAVLFRHNATQIHLGLPGNVFYKDNVFERFTPQQRFYKTPAELTALEKELVELFRTIKFDGSERCMLVARTHELVGVGLRAEEMVQYGNIIPHALRVGQKVMARRNNRDAGITAKQILMLDAIEDCELPRGKTIAELEEIEYKNLPVRSTDAQDTTIKKERGLVRRLRCHVVGATQLVYLPYDGQFVGRVVRAGAVTERSCQGTQADHIFVLKPSYWSEADFKECCYVVCTRQRKRLTLFCPERVFNDWVRNPALRRNSRMGPKISELCTQFARVFAVPGPTPEILALREEEGDRYTPKTLVKATA